MCYLESTHTLHCGYAPTFSQEGEPLILSGTPHGLSPAVSSLQYKSTPLSQKAGSVISADRQSSRASVSLATLVRTLLRGPAAESTLSASIPPSLLSILAAVNAPDVVADVGFIAFLLRCSVACRGVLQAFRLLVRTMAC